MKKSSTLFLKISICLVAVVVFTGLVWFPQTEGRAANLDLISIYKDPLIIYVYVSSISFFVGLFQTITLLNLIDANTAFSQASVNALKNIKYLSLSLIGFIAGAVLYLQLFARGDDAAGPTMLGMCLSLAFGVIATAAGVFQKLFQNAVDMKTESDLTV